MTRRQRIVLLAGGGGGAKLAAGFAALAPDIELCIVANSGDDFDYLGLPICPDLDSLLYAISGRLDTQRGWGRSGETWQVLEGLRDLGGPVWFGLGDKDLALHLLRNQWVSEGLSASDIATRLAHRMGITDLSIVPATDGRLRTELITPEGRLEFQAYFVGRRCEPVVSAIEYTGAAQLTPSQGLREFARAGIDAVVIGPSNPLLSIAPILQIPGMCDLLGAARQVVAVSPVVNGQALKGPLIKIMGELGLEPSAQAWSNLLTESYPDLVDTWIFDEQDKLAAQQCSASGRRVESMDTIMRDSGSAQRLATTIMHVLAAASVQGKHGADNETKETL